MVPGARAWVMLATVLLAGPTSAQAQAPKNGSIASRLSTLHVNSWIQIEGVIQADGSILCTKADLLTGDFLDDDWALEGIIGSVDSVKHEFVVGGLHVQTSQSTRFESPSGVREGFARLHPGMVVDIEGKYVRNRGLLAREVDDESDDVEDEPGIRSRVTVVGRVERVDPRRHLIGSMGMLFHVTDKTRIKSVIE